MLFRTQIPYEMFYCLHETVVEATEELSKHYQKPKSSFDAQALVPYLVLVLIKALQLQQKSEQNEDQEDFMKVNLSKSHTQGLKVRFLLMEHFTVHALGMHRQDYSFVSFKEVEQTVELAVTDEILQEHR